MRQHTNDFGAGGTTQALRTGAFFDDAANTTVAELALVT
jgi:hypothetical protein